MGKKKELSFEEKVYSLMKEINKYKVFSLSDYTRIVDSYESNKRKEEKSYHLGIQFNTFTKDSFLEFLNENDIKNSDTFSFDYNSCRGYYDSVNVELYLNVHKEYFESFETYVTRSLTDILKKEENRIEKEETKKKQAENEKKLYERLKVKYEKE
jgi:hypothetical protein